MNPKKKGNAGENKFAAFLREHGFRAFKDGASGASVHKSDIVNGMDYSIEVKTVKKIGLMEAWKQVDRDASKAKNSPLLAIHFDGMPEKEWIVCMSSTDWIENEKALRDAPVSPQNGTGSVKTAYCDTSSSREAAYAISQLIASAKKVLKHFNE